MEAMRVYPFPMITCQRLVSTQHGWLSFPSYPSPPLSLVEKNLPESSASDTSFNSWCSSKIFHLDEDEMNTSGNKLAGH